MYNDSVWQRETDRAPDLRCVVDSEDGVAGEVDNFVTGWALYRRAEEDKDRNQDVTEADSDLCHDKLLL